MADSLTGEMEVLMDSRKDCAVADRMVEWLVGDGDGNLRIDHGTLTRQFLLYACPGTLSYFILLAGCLQYCARFSVRRGS